MKKKGQLTNNDSALKNSEVCDFSEKSGKPRVLCDFAPLREKEITTENTKKAQRKATSYELRATSREKKAASGQENFFEPLCETSVSSVVKENLNTGGKAASCKPQAASYEPRALCDYASFPIEHRDKLREKDSLRLCALARKILYHKASATET